MSQNCTAIILAGGKSQRMGQPKGLLLYNGRYWIQEHLKRLKLAGITKVLIGLGFDADVYYKAIPELRLALNNYINYEDLQLKVIPNTNPQLGAFSTLKNVLKKADKINDVLICPIDVPVLQASELTKLINTKGLIVKPVYHNKSGHPIKINAQFVVHLLERPNTSRLDLLVSNVPEKDVDKVICSDKQVNMNLNSPKDWKNYLDDIPLSQKYERHEN